MTEASDAIGPIDYLIIEWPDQQPNGEALPHLIDLVDRGLVRVIDLAFVTKSEDGVVAALNVDELGADFAVFDGAASGLLDDGDFAEAANAIEPGTSAAILLWENLWAAPLADALRGNGAQVVARGAVPIDALLETLEAAEA
ncbi:MAG: DUF6325 family protein [Solirubrobacterales bacterium]